MQLVQPFLKGHKTVWKEIWLGKKKFPLLAHFQYGYSMSNHSTTVFAPGAVIDRLVAAWPKK